MVLFIFRLLVIFFCHIFIIGNSSDAETEKSDKKKNETNNG